MALELGDLFRAAATLTGSSSATSETRPADLKDILYRRISVYSEMLGQKPPEGDLGLETLQSHTALEALSLLETLHSCLKAPDLHPEPGQEIVNQESNTQPLVGTRDLATIRTLLSILFKWGVEPLLQRIVAGIPSTSTSHTISRASIIDLTGLPHEYATLSSISSRLLALVLPHGPGSTVSQSAVTATLVNRQLSDLLVPCIVVGWLPKSLASDSMPTADGIRPLLMHLLSRLPAAHVISAAGLALSSPSSSLPYVRKTCTFILSRQLLRPEGIRGLCESVFGEEDSSGEDVALDKLEHVSRLLGAMPAGMKPQEYYGTIVPRMLTLLILDERALPHAHRRAIAFSLSRMLTVDENAQTQEIVMKIVFPMLHDPILNGSGDITPAASLKTMQVLLTNNDPSPHLISALLTPIAPSLYSMYACLEQAKVADPVLRETVRGFLSTWGRLVNSEEAISTIWRIIDGQGSDWRVDVAGEISRVDNAADGQPLSMFTPQSLKEAEEAGEFDVDSNPLGLKPDPIRLVRFIKSLDRADVSSDLFVQLLEAYRESRAQADVDPLKTLLYLQLVLQMQKELSENDTSNVLKNPEHILSFIKHALENIRQPERSNIKKPASVAGLRMEDLRIVEEDEEDELDAYEEGDSDDEDEGDQGHGFDDMTATAVKLLLSVLEANPDLSARTAPVLNDIFSLLEPLSRAPEEELRGLAREARMVMTARLASTSEGAGRRSARPASDASESPQETYQKALKLLQDPLLPVRAHGLMLLRQLVSARKDASGRLTEPALEPALIPGILSIFMQSVQDDDSYMFLNAVQGLSAMVDGFGKDVLRNLINVYSEGLDGLSASTMSQHDVDMRTRVGEALGQVIRRCGDALPSYASLLILPLFRVIRASHFPTVLRTSAISLLAQCVKTNALAVLPYSIELADAMIDLLQVESVPAAPRKPEPKSDSETKADESSKKEAPPPPPTMDAQPTSTNSKFPPLRRAALHFLSILANACTARIYETGHADGFLFPPGLLKRAKTTLGYIAATDADDVVRVMARETMEALDQLAEAVLGL